jgi:antitoxin (DNA-binding transcriptional repressor) of toxin-antitoxin stability system
MRQNRIMDTEEARKQLPCLLGSASRGETTTITTQGKPVADVPVSEALARKRVGENFLRLHGTGRGLYGNVARHINGIS